MKKINVFIFLLILSISACDGLQKKGAPKIVNEAVTQKIENLSIEDIFNNSPEIVRDLTEIKQSGVLRAVTTNSSTSYFAYKGQVMGYEYELLTRLSDYLNVELEVIVAKDALDLFKQLYSGNADIIAHGITITQDREKYLKFTNYLFLTHQVLVQKKPDLWRNLKLHEIQAQLISDPIELIGDTVSVRKNSAYFSRLVNLSEEIGGKIEIDTLPANFETDEIIEMVVDGRLKYTVADKHIAEINASYYPELDIKTAIGFSQRIAWAARNNSPELVEEVNKWLATLKRTNDFNMIYQKYFKNRHDFRKRTDSEFYSMNESKISKYDDLIKKYAEEINWDWRLLSSLVYQESQFNPHVKSWVEAQGLMQLMPATANELGIENISDPGENIKGGTKYLYQLWERWNTIQDSVQRIKFTMASYNCGYYHVKDARNLTIKNNLSGDRWDDNVELYMLKLSNPEFYNDSIVGYGYARGLEPVTYVQEIFERYEHYCNFIPL